MLTEAYDADAMKKSNVFERRKRFKEGWEDAKAWILHHDTALAHDALAVREFLAKKSTMKLDHIRRIWPRATFGYSQNSRPL
jgi:hypothetical protein